jgi:hypothetical protein
MEEVTITGLVAEAGRQSVAKGFHEVPTTLPEQLSLLHSEVSEVLDDYRDNHPFTKTWIEVKDDGATLKPRGIPIELADVVIKACEIAHRYGVDLNAAIATKLTYNATRPRLHGGKRV